jgi:histidinol-phosphatase (PHP family)
MRDYHVHSNYSDGFFLFGMIDAAERAGLEGIGFADHCSVSSREGPRQLRARYGFNLDLTHERRRDALEHHRTETDLAVYDAVEMDYDPRDEDAIRSFLEEAGFAYAIGSVHVLDGRNVQNPGAFGDESDGVLDDLVDRYFDRLVSLVESGLFDVAAHPDLIERTPQFRGRASQEHYRRAAAAFAEHRTVPEINVGRALSDADIVHPAPAFLDLLREYDVPVTVASDAHQPAELVDRHEFLEDFLADRGLEPVAPPGLGR